MTDVWAIVARSVSEGRASLTLIPSVTLGATSAAVPPSFVSSSFFSDSLSFATPQTPNGPHTIPSIKDSGQHGYSAFDPGQR